MPSLEDIINKQVPDLTPDRMNMMLGMTIGGGGKLANLLNISPISNIPRQIAKGIYPQVKDPINQMVVNMYMNRLSAGLSKDAALRQTMEWGIKHPQIGMDKTVEAAKMITGKFVP